MTSIRVLHVRNCRGITAITGAETHLLALLDRGRDHGVESLLICMTDPRHGTTPWLSELARRRVRVEIVPVRHAWSIRDLREVARWIRTFDADLVHTMDHRADVVGVAAAGRTSRPVVATCHGWTNWSSASLRGRLYPLVDRLALARTDLVVTNSAAMARTLGSSTGGPAVVTIPNGVDTTEFDPSRHPPGASPETPGTVTLGVVARLHPNKGQLELVDLLPELLAAHPRLRLRLIGDVLPGFETYRSALTRRIAELHLGDIVTTGPAPPERIPSEMASLDILVAPSVTESFSFSLLEAMAMERAVVATAVGGTPELIEHDESGLLVPPGDPAALRDALARLIGDAELRQRLGRAARRRVEAEFSLEAMVAETIDLQRQVVDCRRAHPGAAEARRALRARLEARPASRT